MAQDCETCGKAEDHFKYYTSFRDEIKREDEITHHRMITSMTFQGLLMAATGFMISGTWSKLPPGFSEFRLNAIFGIGLIGLIVAMITTVGILASRLSIDDVKSTFEKLTRVENGAAAMLPIDQKAPQIHGRGAAFRMGKFYTIFIPLAFVLMWSMYLCIFAYFVWSFGEWVIAGVLAITLIPFGGGIFCLSRLGTRPADPATDPLPAANENAAAADAA